MLENLNMFLGCLLTRIGYSSLRQFLLKNQLKISLIISFNSCKFLSSCSYCLLVAFSGRLDVISMIKLPFSKDFGSSMKLLRSFFPRNLCEVNSSRKFSLRHLDSRCFFRKSSWSFPVFYSEKTNLATPLRQAEQAKLPLRSWLISMKSGSLQHCATG